MKIIAVMNEKGGTGKTTVAVNLATALHRRGGRVVLVDADPQGSARDWRAASPEGANLPIVIAMDRPQALSEIHALHADVVVIDTPAKAEAMAAAVVRLADLVLIVLQPSGPDVWATAATVKLVRAKTDAGGSIDAALLINRTSGTTKLTKQITAGEWNEYGLDQLDSTLGNRVAFASAMTDGVSIYETQDGTAKAEIDAVITELEQAKWL